MLISELSNLHDVVSYGLLQREQSEKNIRNYTVATLANDIYSKVLEQWKWAYSCFVVPISHSRLRVLKNIEEN